SRRGSPAGARAPARLLAPAPPASLPALVGPPIVRSSNNLTRRGGDRGRAGRHNRPRAGVTAAASGRRGQARGGRGGGGRRLVVRHAARAPADGGGGYSSPTMRRACRASASCSDRERTSRRTSPVCSPRVGAGAGGGDVPSRRSG